MSTLHETISTGNAQQLGPVTVIKCWPQKTAKNGNPFRSIVVSDHTTPGGEVSLTIWGAAATVEYAPGTALIFRPVGKGSIGTKDYNGKVQVNCDQCLVEPVGQQVAQPHPAQQVAQQIAAPATPHAANPFAPPQPSPVTQPACVPGTKIPAESIAKTAAKYVAHYVGALVAVGFTREEAITIASGLNNAPPAWFFGEKTVFFSEDN